ncbi:MAG: polysaccharide lyase 6 family protein [Verrucomicrobiaceae bacterium]|nr:polysaccharide lyase 6 family protein [Verrucomicrobiaceae bacterium]
MNCKLCLAIALFSGGWASCKELRLDSPAALEGATYGPGDTLVLPVGEFADVKLSLIGDGITLKAAVPGKTILTGSSSLKFAGRGLRIEGLLFRDPGPDVSEVIQFRKDSRTLASDSTLVDCAIVADPGAQAKHKESKWCSIYGKGNTLERCAFIGKANKGTTVVVWLADEATGGHMIKGCYFGDRPKLGKNGGETIRIGDSETSHLDARCVVASCLFERCNGEGEIISNKSCGNIYRGNTFRECEGALTLRHGHRALVEKNLFIGNGKPLTGGVRIIGEDHVVTGNAMVELRGDEYRSAITFMNALPNTPANGYQQVKRAVVENNTIINCKAPFTIGMKHDSKCTLPPVEVSMKSNVVHSPKSKLITLMSEAPGWTWSGNTFTAKEPGAEVPGVTLTQASTPEVPIKAVSRSAAGPVWLGGN